MAAANGHVEIVKFLTTLTDNPNIQNKWGKTPIHAASCGNHTDIIKILAPWTNNPIVQNDQEKNPSSVSKIRKVMKTKNASRKHNAGSLEKPFKKRAKKL